MTYRQALLATLLEVYQNKIEELSLEMDELEFASQEWQKVAKRHYAERMKRQGAKELAFVLGIISEDEYDSCTSDLIEALKVQNEQ